MFDDFQNRYTIWLQSAIINRQSAIRIIIELLVVIAIIALLAALLLPALRSARGKAKSVQCMGHIKQQALATYLYTTDSNDVLPLFFRNATAQYTAGTS